MSEQFFKKYGIGQVTIPLPFRLNHIHCYLARQGEKDWTIIDTGLHRRETLEGWQNAFSHYGVKNKDIRKILVTHYHPDHFGYAGGLQEQTHAQVFMGQESYSRGLENWTEETHKQFHAFYGQVGMGGNTREELLQHDLGFFPMVRPFPTHPHFLQEGELFQIGELTFQAIHTPGHEQGHFCFYNSEEKILLSGDHLLKKITPNISYLGFGEENPLAIYLSSLKKIAQLEINWVLPGHGPIFSDAAERIEELLQHHEARIKETYDVLVGEMTASQICRKLFQRELTIHEERFAIGETVAHLAYLCDKGEIKKTSDSSEVWYYQDSKLG